MMGTLRRSWKDWQVFLIAHALFACIALAPFLFGSGLFSSIGVGHIYPFFSVNTVENWMSGAMWINHLNMNGYPSFVTNGFLFNPFTYLFTAFFPTFSDVHWFVFANVLVGGLLSAIFLRRIGFSRFGSVTGSVSYVTGCWWLTVTGDYVCFYPMLPLAAFIATDLHQHPIRSCVLGSLLSAYIWLGTNVQVSLMVFTALAVGSVLLTVRDRKHRNRFAEWPIVVFLVSAAIGSLISLPKILLSLVYGGLSWRTEGLPLEISTASGIEPLTIVTYLFPYAKFPFLNFGGDLTQIFIGTFGFFFLIVGCIRALSSRSSSLRWWLGAYVFLLLLSIAHSPIAMMLHSIWPFTNFRGVGRWMMIGSFIAAPLVAAGFDWLFSEGTRQMRSVLSRIFGWFIALLVSVLILGQGILTIFSSEVTGFFQKYFAHFHNVLGLQTSLPYYQAFVERRVQELLVDPFFLQPRSLIPILSLVILGVLLHCRIWEKLQNREAVFASMCLLTTSLTLAWYDTPLPRRALAENHPLEEIVREDHGTVLGLFSNLPLSALGSDTRLTKSDELRWAIANLMPNTNMLYGVSSLDYFDVTAARRPTALASLVGAQWMTETPDVYRLMSGDEALTEKVSMLRQRKSLLDLQGVRYLTSPVDLPAPFRRMATVTGAVLPVMIYENPRPRPRVYFANSVETMSEEEEEALKRMMNETWTERRSLIECEPTCITKMSSGRGTVEILEDRPTFIAMKTRTASPEWLIVTVNRLPGWSVRLDDEPIDTYFANAAYFGIPIPAGEHTVRLEFSVLTIMREAIDDIL